MGRVYNKIKYDIETWKVLEEDSYDYNGPWAYCDATSADSTSISSSSISSSSSSSSSSLSSSSTSSSSSSRSSSSSSSFSCWVGVDDDFTGTNGDPPAPQRWTIYKGSPTIQSNQLYMTSNPENGITSKHHLIGDFVATLDYDLATYPTPYVSNWIHWFRIINVYDANDYTHINFIGDSTPPYFRVSGDVLINGSGAAASYSSGTLPTNSQVRLRRVGTTIYCEIFHSTWIIVKQRSGFPTSDVYLRILSDTYNSNPFTGIYWDNLVIEADGITCPLSSSSSSSSSSVSSSSVSSSSSSLSSSSSSSSSSLSSSSLSSSSSAYCLNLSSNRARNGIATASSELAGLNAYEAFDGIVAYWNSWAAAGTDTTPWIKYDFGSGVQRQIENIRIYGQQQNYPSRVIVNGSSNGVAWVEMTDQNLDWPVPTAYQSVDIGFINRSQWRFIRLSFPDQPWVRASEIELYECNTTSSSSLSTSSSSVSSSSASFIPCENPLGIPSPLWTGGGSINSMGVDNNDNLIFITDQNLGSKNIYRTIGASIAIDSSIWLPSPYNSPTTATPYYAHGATYINEGSVSNKICYIIGAGNTAPAYLGFRGWWVEVDPMTTNKTYEIQLEFSWPNAIYTFPRFAYYDGNEDWIVGLVSAWNSVGGTRNRIVRWDRSTGASIGTITSTPSPYNGGSKGWIDSANQYMYIYCNIDKYLRWYDYTQVTTTSALSAVGSVGTYSNNKEGNYGAAYSPNSGKMYFLDEGIGYAQVTQYIGISTTELSCSSSSVSSSSSLSSSSSNSSSSSSSSYSSSSFSGISSSSQSSSSISSSSLSSSSRSVSSSSSQSSSSSSSSSSLSSSSSSSSQSTGQYAYFGYNPLSPFPGDHYGVTLDDDSRTSGAQNAETINVRRNINYIKTGLIDFDLRWMADSTSQVVNAYLYLKTTDTGPAGIPISAHNVKKGWTPSRVNWIDRTGPAEWSIVARGALDTDVDTYPTPMDTITPTVADTWYRWDVTVGVLDILANQNLSSNNGFVLRYPRVGGTAVFGETIFHGNGAADDNDKPYLVIALKDYQLLSSSSSSSSSSISVSSSSSSSSVSSSSSSSSRSVSSSSSSISSLSSLSCYESTLIFGNLTQSIGSGNGVGTYRSVIDASEVTDISADSIQLTFGRGSLLITIYEAWIGYQNPAGDVLDFDPTKDKVQVTFNGGDSDIYMWDHATYDSDRISFQSDGTSNIIISFYASRYILWRYVGGSPVLQADTYRVLAVNESSTTDVNMGDYTFMSSGAIDLLTKINQMKCNSSSSISSSTSVSSSSSLSNSSSSSSWSNPCVLGWTETAGETVWTTDLGTWDGSKWESQLSGTYQVDISGYTPPAFLTSDPIKIKITLYNDPADDPQINSITVWDTTQPNPASIGDIGKDVYALDGDGVSTEITIPLIYYPWETIDRIVIDGGSNNFFVTNVEIYDDCGTAHRISVFSETNDGYVERYGAASWATIRNDTTGDLAGDTEGNAVMCEAEQSGSSYWIQRGFFEFDLSVVDTTESSVDSIVVGVVGYGWDTESRPGSYPTIQEATISDGASLTVADYDAFTGPEFTDRVPEWYWYWNPDTINHQNRFYLNSAGDAYVLSKLGQGSAKFCVREKDHDYDDAAPGASTQYLLGATYRNYGDSPNTGARYRTPRIIITYLKVPTYLIAVGPSYWNIDNDATWDGTRYSSGSFDAIELSGAGTWLSGYKPYKISFNFTGADELYVQMFNTEGGEDLFDGHHVFRNNEEKVIWNYNNYDLDVLQLFNNGSGPFQVHNIEIQDP